MTRSTLSFAARAALLVGCVLFVPDAVEAQWYLGGYIGASHTQNATVSVREPGLALDFHDVHFYSLSWEPRRYYGLRLGKFLGESRLGLELEMIHMKAIGDTTRNYRVTVIDGERAPDVLEPMNSVVQEYQMTHGLNFALVNLVLRRPAVTIGGRDLAILARVGAGPTFPHGETTVSGGVVHEYQYAGFGAQAAAGLEIDLPFRGLAFGEYKLTYARPEIDTTAGTASSTALSHHISFGLGIALTRR